MFATGPYWWYVNNGSINGLVPSGNKQLSKPMSTRTEFNIAIWCQQDTFCGIMAGSETCFVWNDLTVVFILEFWSYSSQWPQGTRSADPIGRLWVRAGYPEQETKWRWSDHPSHQRRYAISSTHLNDQRHIWKHLYLTDRICNGKSFQILGFYSASVHVLLFVFKTQGYVWGNLVNYIEMIQIVPNDLNNM